jgi:multidrug resistance efflux pump
LATQQGLDNQRSAVTQLTAQNAKDQAARDAAAVQLSYTKLVAPFDGRTGLRIVDVGKATPTSSNSQRLGPYAILSTPEVGAKFSKSLGP